MIVRNKTIIQIDSVTIIKDGIDEDGEREIVIEQYGPEVGHPGPKTEVLLNADNIQQLTLIIQREMGKLTCCKVFPTIPVLYEIDPDTDAEATGTVLPFCSEKCRATFLTRPDFVDMVSPGCTLEPGENDRTDFDSSICTECCKPLIPEYRKEDNHA